MTLPTIRRRKITVPRCIGLYEELIDASDPVTNRRRIGTITLYLEALRGLLRQREEATQRLMMAQLNQARGHMAANHRLPFQLN